MKRYRSKMGPIAPAPTTCQPSNPSNVEGLIRVVDMRTITEDSSDEELPRDPKLCPNACYVKLIRVEQELKIIGPVIRSARHPATRSVSVTAVRIWVPNTRSRYNDGIESAPNKSQRKTSSPTSLQNKKRRKAWRKNLVHRIKRYNHLVSKSLTTLKQQTTNIQRQRFSLPCPNCINTFSSQRLLSVHLNTHNNEPTSSSKPRRWRKKCRQCPKAYFWSWDLARHIRNHHATTF